MEREKAHGAQFFSVDVGGVRTPLISTCSLSVMLADGRELEIFLDEEPGCSQGITVVAPNREVGIPTKGFALLLRPGACNVLRIAVEVFAADA